MGTANGGGGAPGGGGAIGTGGAGGGGGGGGGMAGAAAVVMADVSSASGATAVDPSCDESRDLVTSGCVGDTERMSPADETCAVSVVDVWSMPPPAPIGDSVSVVVEAAAICRSRRLLSMNSRTASCSSSSSRITDKCRLRVRLGSSGDANFTINVGVPCNGTFTSFSISCDDKKYIYC